MNAPPFRIEILPAGWVFDSDGATPLLQAAEAAGIVLPSSCRNGSCRTCLCVAEGGQAAHLIEWPGLSAEEKGDGCILPCCATAKTDMVPRVPAERRA